MAGSEAIIEIRPLTALADLSQAFDLQRRIWGFADVDLLPLRFFVVASKLSSQVFGAYHQTKMIGFCLGVPGMQPDGRSYLHSHMLGVLPECRDMGVGLRLKLRQRAEALAAGLELVEWTFDPLEPKNAFFNLERLGAVTRQYVENAYGTTSSPLHGGLPTDRCVAEWWIATPRVEAILSGKQVERSATERICVPLEIDRIRREHPERAREIQRANAARFQSCFERGLAATGVETTALDAVYLLEPWR